MSKFLRSAVLVCLLGIVAGCGQNPVDEPLRFQGQAMSTSYSVIVYAPEREKLRLEVGIQRRLADVVSTMSTYEPESDVSRFNRAPTDLWVPVSADVVKVVQASLDLAAQTQGAFEPTILPLVNIWGFGPLARPEEIPTEAELTEALALVGWEAIDVQVDPPALRKRAPREIDLSAIAKGFGADRVAEYLLELGYNRFLVEIGGDMRTSGTKPDGTGWRVGIETPEPGISRQAYRIVELVEDTAIVTSGDYRNYFEVDGQRYAHTLDPATGFPVTHRLASVSVLAENAMLADGWATALTVMQPNDAFALAETIGLSVYLIERSANGFEERMTGEFKHLLGAGVE